MNGLSKYAQFLSAQLTTALDIFFFMKDGASTVGEERILVIGATNRPKDLDEAARRRLSKR